MMMNMLHFFKYHYCKMRMTAFVNGELSMDARRRIARYIDECPRCYAEYAHQRGLQQELMRTLPGLGKPDERQVSAMWDAIQRDLQPSATQQKPRVPHYQLRYGMATIVIVLILALPLTLSDTAANTTVSVTHPRPVANHTISTISPQSTPIAVVATPVETINNQTATTTAEAAPQRTPDENS